MSRVDHRGRHRERIAEVRAGRSSEHVPYPILIRELEVLRTSRVGAGLIRVTLGGPGLAGFATHVPDDHVKLIFPEDDGTLRIPEQDGLMLRWPRPFPPNREYTIRRHDAAAGELDIDIACHPGGLGAGWAETVEPGTPVHVAGPPGARVVPYVYDRYLLAGDLTALPAIARWLEELPRTASGWAFIEVADAAQEIPLSAPEDVTVVWLHGTGHIEDAVQAVEVPAGERLYVWLAGEASALKPLRRWIRDDLGLGPADHDVTGYWKLGVADFDEDDEHEHHHDHAH